MRCLGGNRGNRPARGFDRIALDDVRNASRLASQLKGRQNQQEEWANIFVYRNNVQYVELHIIYFLLPTCSLHFKLSTVFGGRSAEEQNVRTPASSDSPHLDKCVPASFGENFSRAYVLTCRPLLIKSSFYSFHHTIISLQKCVWWLYF